MKIIEEFISHSDAKFIKVNRKVHGKSVTMNEVRLPDGQGVRIDPQNNTFTLLEPSQQ